MARTTLYRYFDRDNHLLYVGITGSGSTRMHAHAGSAAKWWGKVHHATFKHFASRDRALAAETEAIRTELPIYNKAQRVFGTRYLHDIFAMIDALPPVQMFVSPADLAYMLNVQPILVVRACREDWFDYITIGPRTYLIRIEGLRERVREYVQFAPANLIIR